MNGEPSTDPETLASHAAVDRMLAETAEDAERLVTTLAELQARADNDPDAEDAALEAADAAWREYTGSNVYGTGRSVLFRFTMAGFGTTIQLETEAEQSGWREYTVTAVRLVGNAGRGDRVLEVQEEQPLWTIAERLVEEV